ncbi:GAP family protein [Actinocorallia aurantiaca]|uniref:Sap-like sulfolipid-1-addressing protein n=1 Tax=Actinocorallia aurantiaca TaxID=46204 RepID=A0ABN3UC50_9ACTN
MSASLLASLVGLALLDSMSIGTLFIPVWLLLAPGRVSAGRVLVYLATIGIFYFAVGLLVLGGATSIAAAVGDTLDERTALWIQLAVGAVLFALSFRFDGQGGASRRRERVATGSPSVGPLVGLALLAALAEVATMLPYLGAIAMLGSSDLGAPLSAILLAGYCLVMVFPAALLLLARVIAAHRVEPLLHRLGAWLTAHAAGATGWILAIAGFLVARDAAAHLWFTDPT